MLMQSQKAYFDILERHFGHILRQMQQLKTLSCDRRTPNLKLPSNSYKKKTRIFRKKRPNSTGNM